MANLVRIQEAYLYVGFTPNAANTYAAISSIKAASPNVIQMTYADPVQHQSVFDSLRTWTFGPSGATYQKTFTDFPFAHWTEVYDDYTLVLQAADGLAEIQESKLIANANSIISGT